MESLHSCAFNDRNEIRLGRNLANEKIIMEIKFSEMLNSRLDPPLFFFTWKILLSKSSKMQSLQNKIFKKKSVHCLSICMWRESENVRLGKKIVAEIILELKIKLFKLKVHFKTLSG